MKTLAIIATLAAVPAVRRYHYTVVVVFENIALSLPPAVIEAIMLVLHGPVSFISVGDDFFAFTSHALFSHLSSTVWTLFSISFVCLSYYS